MESRDALTREELLSSIVNLQNLYSQQSTLQQERFSTLLEKNNAEINITINNLLDRMSPPVERTPGPAPIVPPTPGPAPIVPPTPGPTPIIPPTPEPTPIIPPIPPVTSSDEKVRELEDQIRGLRGENTWEQDLCNMQEILLN